MAQRRRLIGLVAVAATVLVGCTSTSRTPAAGTVVAATAPMSSNPVVNATATATATASAPATAPASAAATAAPSGPASATVSATASGPCGRVGTASVYSHVVWIWMENKPYDSVIGQSGAPYENALATQCGQATDYHGITHPSLPNYLAATGGSTFGVTDDADPSSHPVAADSIFGQLAMAGLSWRAYLESMPKNCDLSASGRYGVKHNPAAYYTAIRAACATNDVALDPNLGHDIAAGTLPSFSFVTPNLCNDTHDCSVHTGDAWLATWIPKLVDGPNYRSGNTLIVLTWDEGVGSANLIPTIVVGPSVAAGTVSTVRLDHYALLRTTEELLGLRPLGSAADAASMRADFRL